MSEPKFTEEEMRAAQSAAADVMNSIEGLTRLQQDVQNLVGTNKIVQDKFTEVGLKLKAIDTGVLPNGEKINPGEPFFPPWDALQTRFNELVNESNDTAATLGTYCQAFDTVILPFATDKVEPPLTKEEKKQLLEGFKHDAGEKHTASQVIKDKFELLLKDITQFSARFEGFAADRIKQNKEHIDNLNIDIGVLKAEIDDLSVKIMGLYIGLGLALFAGTIGFAVAFIFPGIGALILLVCGAAVVAFATAIGVLTTQKDGKQEDVNKKQEEIKKLLESIKQLEAAQATLANIRDSDIPTLTGALSSFSGIWQQVVGETQSAYDWIVLGSSPFNPDPVVYQYLQKANSVYGPLGRGMLDYAENIKSPELLEEARKRHHNKSKRHIPHWAKGHPALVEAVHRLYEKCGPLTAF